jgi:hypothetical protein
MAMFYVGGTLNDDCYLWLMADSGTAIIKAQGIPQTVIPAEVDYLAAAPTIAGGLYVGCGNKVYKLNRTSRLLDTTWATAGVYTAPSAITGIATDTAGYLAVSCTANETTANIALLNASGVLVWAKTYTGWGGGQGATSFRADNGNVLYGPYFTSITPKVLELDRTTGATVVTRGDDGTAWDGVTACQYIVGAEPYWFIRTSAAESEVVSASAGTLTVDEFSTDAMFEFDVNTTVGTVVIAVGTREL